MLLASLLIAGAAAGSNTAVTLSLVLLGLGWSAAVVAGSALVAESVQVRDRPALQGASDLGMNAAGALGGASAGPVLATVGYSGLGFASTVLVAVVVVWTARQVRGGGGHARRRTNAACGHGAPEVSVAISALGVWA